MKVNSKKIYFDKKTLSTFLNDCNNNVVEKTYRQSNYFLLYNAKFSKRHNDTKKNIWKLFSNKQEFDSNML